MENLVIPRVELAMKSFNGSSGQDMDNVVPDRNQRVLPGNIQGLQMTALSRMNSNIDLNKIDETCGNITVEVGDLPVSVKNFDRHTNTHPNAPLQLQLRE